MTLAARAALIVVILVGIAAGWWRLTAFYDRQGYDRAQAEYTSAALVASEAARAKEKTLQAANLKVDHALQIEKTRRLAAERATADSLRDFQSALDSATHSDPATPGRVNDTGGLERELLGECSNHLAALALTADRLESKVVGLQSYARDVCASQ